MGVLGLAIAWECSQRGAQVRVLDNQPYQRSSSYGLVGALTAHVPEPWEAKKQFQFESLLMAETWWARINTASGINPHYNRCGRLQPIMDEVRLELAQRRVFEANKNWGTQAEMKIAKVTDYPIWHPPSPTGWLLTDNLSARINPRLAINSLRTALLNKNVPLLDLNEQNNSKSKFRVLATGTAGLNLLSRELDLPIVAHEKGQAMLIALEASDQPIITGGGINIVPQPNGVTAIGSTTERYFENPHKTDHKLDELFARAAELLPFIKNAPIIEKWAHDRPRSVTRAPILGAHPIQKNTFIANGGFKIGLGMAPKIAQVMADLILDGVDGIPYKFSFENVVAEATRQNN